jgi:hypothetical protein
VICSNCESTKHRACCHRCGALIPTRRKGLLFCTLRCDRAQDEEDRLSAAEEEYEAELNAELEEEKQPVIADRSPVESQD